MDVENGRDATTRMRTTTLERETGHQTDGRRPRDRDDFQSDRAVTKPYARCTWKWNELLLLNEIRTSEPAKPVFVSRSLPHSPYRSFSLALVRSYRSKRAREQGHFPLHRTKKIKIIHNSEKMSRSSHHFFSVQGGFGRILRGNFKTEVHSQAPQNGFRGRKVYQNFVFL